MSLLSQIPPNVHTLSSQIAGSKHELLSSPVKLEENPQSILKSPSRTAVKRHSPDHDTGIDSLTSPSKRFKVEFSDNVEIRSVDDLGGKSLVLVSEEVLHAIRNKETGNREAYDEIVQMFSAEPRAEDSPSDSDLGKYLLGLTNNISLMKKHCSDLVHAVLQTQWLARNSMFVTIYTRFLAHLLTSHFGFMASALKMLVENFAHISTSAGNDFTPQNRPKLQASVHTALRNVLMLTPSSTPILRGILSSSFPFPTDSKKAHVEYVRNLLKIVEYAPELKSDILDIITERLIKIDVEVQINMEDSEEDINEILALGREVEEQLQLNDEDNDDLSDVESVASDEDILSEKEKRVKDLKSAVEKMDAIIDMLFIHYDSTLAIKQVPLEGSISKSRVQPSLAESDANFNQLLMQFGKNILPTYRSRHTQFLIFHFAQISERYTNRFIDYCISILQDKARSSTLRLSAAAYVASFVARASHVSTDIVIYVFDSLASFLERMRCDYEPACRGPDLRKYSAYYATAQALIYIFCFRWKDLLADPEDNDADEEELLFNGDPLIWAPGTKEVFQKNFFSKLNPLKVCAPEIVEEFARMARHLQFLYIYQILEANKRVRLSQSSALRNAQRESSLSQLHGERYQQLELFFPFDPYQLPLSRRWVSEDYNEWKGAPEPDDQSKHEDYDSSDEDELPAKSEDFEAVRKPFDESESD